jgi:hypothetical protein
MKLALPWIEGELHPLYGSFHEKKTWNYEGSLWDTFMTDYWSSTHADGKSKFNGEASESNVNGEDTIMTPWWMSFSEERLRLERLDQECVIDEDLGWISRYIEPHLRLQVEPTKSTFHSNLSSLWIQFDTICLRRLLQGELQMIEAKKLSNCIVNSEIGHGFTAHRSIFCCSIRMEKCLSTRKEQKYGEWFRLRCATHFFFDWIFCLSATDVLRVRPTITRKRKAYESKRIHILRVCREIESPLMLMLKQLPITFLSGLKDHVSRLAWIKPHVKPVLMLAQGNPFDRLPTSLWMEIVLSWLKHQDITQLAMVNKTQRKLVHSIPLTRIPFYRLFHLLPPPPPTPASEPELADFVPHYVGSTLSAKACFTRVSVKKMHWSEAFLYFELERSEIGAQVLDNFNRFLMDYKISSAPLKPLSSSSSSSLGSGASWKFFRLPRSASFSGLAPGSGSASSKSLAERTDPGDNFASFWILKSSPTWTSWSLLFPRRPQPWKLPPSFSLVTNDTCGVPEILQSKVKYLCHQAGFSKAHFIQFADFMILPHHCLLSDYAKLRLWKHIMTTAYISDRMLFHRSGTDWLKIFALIMPKFTSIAKFD